MINNLGNFIRKIRGDLSLREFSEKIGISHTHLDNIEKGVDFRTGKRVSITLDTFGKLAIALNAPIADLLELAAKDGLISQNALNINAPENLVYPIQITKEKYPLPVDDRQRLIKELCDADDETAKELEQYLNYLKSKKEQAATGTER